MVNKFGRDSEIYIKAKNNKGFTSLDDCYFTAPCKIAKPFFNEENGMMNIIVMSASAGIMEGDCYHTKVELGVGARMALHSQAYTKIHRMQEGQATQANLFFLAPGAFLDYAPKPTIPYACSSFHSVSECYLDTGAAFLYSDILACGREKKGECFAFTEYRSCNKVYYHGELIFLDRQMLVPASQHLSGIGFFEGYTDQGTLGFFYDSVDDQLLKRLFNILEKIPNIEFGLTKTNRYGIIMRVLGNSADYLLNILNELKRTIYRNLA